MGGIGCIIKSKTRTHNINQSNNGGNKMNTYDDEPNPTHVHDDHTAIHLTQRDHDNDHANNVVHYHDDDIIDAFEYGYITMWGIESYRMLAIE